MQAFTGIRVIDFTHVLAGPFCTYQLAVMGADVVKIESPHEPDMMRSEGHSESLRQAGRNTQFISQNGNKRSLSIDITQPEGLDIVRQLIVDADVLVENYRGGVMERLGLGYDAVKALNPNIIYCSMTGFGHTGPKSEHPAYDNVIQAFSGLMAATGTKDIHPVRVGPPVLDFGTGAQAAFAIAAALYQRTHTQAGQKIDVAMADAALMLMSTHIMDTQMLGTSPDPHGNQNPVRAAYSMYDTADGQCMIGAVTHKQAQRLWRALGRDDIADSVADYAADDFARDNEQHNNTLQQILMTHSADYWEQHLNDAGVPAARVRRTDEALAHPQILSRNVLQSSDTTPETNKQLLAPVAAFGYDHDGPMLSSPAPAQGQHSRDILQELGLDEDTINRLTQSGIVLAA